MDLENSSNLELPFHERVAAGEKRQLFVLVGYQAGEPLRFEDTIWLVKDGEAGEEGKPKIARRPLTAQEIRGEDDRAAFLDKQQDVLWVYCWRLGVAHFDRCVAKGGFTDEEVRAPTPTPPSLFLSRSPLLSLSLSRSRALSFSLFRSLSSSRS